MSQPTGMSFFTSLRLTQQHSSDRSMQLVIEKFGPHDHFESSAESYPTKRFTTAVNVV